MAKYKLKTGGHIQDGKEYNAGDVIDTDIKLDELFPNKFEKQAAEEPAEERPVKKNLTERFTGRSTTPNKDKSEDDADKKDSSKK